MLDMPTEQLLMLMEPRIGWPHYDTKLHLIVIYSDNKYAYIHIYMFMHHHNDTIIDRRTMIKSQEQTTHAGKKMQEDFFIKYFTSHLYLYVSKGLFQVCVWERAGDRTLLKYFDPKVMAVSVVSFSFFMAAQPDPGVNSSVCWLSLLQHVYLRLPLYCLPSFSPISTGSLNSTDRNSTRRPYITFKLPRADMDTPPRLLPISSVIQFRGHTLPVRQSMRV